MEDTISVLVRFESGAIGTITATTAAYPGRPMRILVNGDRGSGLVENDQLRSLHTAQTPSVSGSDAFGYCDLEEAYLAQYADFATAVEQGRRAAVTTMDGRNAFTLILGAYDSVRNGGAPVQLRLQEGHHNG